ncbi:pilus assembly protein TadG [Ensifer adhaerens]|uniref:Pilus assembly protein TadG n=1 Tax=Ensifer adhaerens TaxID=106592 RepID=A0A0L8BGD2_ENSAD|nr:TadE/TadG family type IV pilus assembly protein [Ensifer adhaerens]KOF13623.1 pilus assembly protein TadG [Ensifer adhaerens]
MSIEQETLRPQKGAKPLRGMWGRFRRDRKGTASIEFAILALPFFMVIFASIETFLAFYGDQLLANATETLARKIRTGEITFNRGKPATDMDEVKFREAFCNEISVLMTCSATEAAEASKLYIDVRTVTDLTKFPVLIPRMDTSSSSSDLKTTDLKFAPGGPGSFNVMRAYYRWSVMTDLIRPFVTNLRPAGSSMPKDYLMVSTTTFRTENE